MRNIIFTLTGKKGPSLPGKGYAAIVATLVSQTSSVSAPAPVTLPPMSDLSVQFEFKGVVEGEYHLVVQAVDADGQNTGAPIITAMTVVPLVAEIQTEQSEDKEWIFPNGVSMGYSDVA